MPAIIELIEFTNKGMPPIAGGALNQSQWFLSALSFYNHEAAQAEAEQMKR